MKYIIIFVIDFIKCIQRETAESRKVIDLLTIERDRATEKLLPTEELSKAIVELYDFFIY